MMNLVILCSKSLRRCSGSPGIRFASMNMADAQNNVDRCKDDNTVLENVCSFDLYYKPISDYHRSSLQKYPIDVPEILKFILIYMRAGSFSLVYLHPI